MHNANKSCGFSSNTTFQSTGQESPIDKYPDQTPPSHLAYQPNLFTKYSAKKRDDLSFVEECLNHGHAYIILNNCSKEIQKNLGDRKDIIEKAIIYQMH